MLTSMIMKCRECNEEMGLAELLTFVEAYFIKNLIIPMITTFVLDAIKNKVSINSKGVIDETMAGLANRFEIACPKCKKIDCWISAQKQSPKKLKSNNKIATP